MLKKQFFSEPLVTETGLSKEEKQFEHKLVLSATEAFTAII